jgi:MFS family permease
MTVHDMNRSRPKANSRWLALAVLALAQFMVVLDVTIVNVALPAIQGDLGFSADGLQWVVNAYTLAFGGLLLGAFSAPRVKPDAALVAEATAG